MNLFRWFLLNYKLWKKFQTFPEAIRQTGRWPSETYMKYPPHHQFEGRKVLNFGCGKSTYASENVTNLDVVAGKNINVVCTSNLMPFEDNSFDLVLANHVLEHVPNWFESFKEMARVVKPGGFIEVWIPPVSSDSAYTYRDHINRIGIHSFAGCASMARSGHNVLAEEEFKQIGEVSKLELVRVSKRPIVRWFTMLAWPSLLAFMAEHLRNIITEEQFLFRKK